MKRFRRSRDDGTFALTTLQNPTVEVRSRAELIAAAQKNVADEACLPAAPAPGAPLDQNSPAPPEAHHPQPASPEPSPQERPQKPSPFPIRMEVRTQPSGEMEYRYVLGQREPLPFAPIRDAATRARLAKHFAEEDAKAFRSAATKSPASSNIIASEEPFDPPIPYVPNAISPDFDRHSRRCTVCAHPDRDAIEADFVRWRNPETIAGTYGLTDRASLYRHAHATGLFARRKRETCRVLENILECVDTCPAPMLDMLIRATRAYAHLDDQGRWFEPPRTQYVVYGPPPADERESNEATVGARHAVPALTGPATSISDAPLGQPKDSPEILTATHTHSKKPRKR